jgi:hypothetical protein
MWTRCAPDAWPRAPWSCTGSTRCCGPSMRPSPASAAACACARSRPPSTNRSAWGTAWRARSRARQTAISGCASSPRGVTSSTRRPSSTRLRRKRRSPGRSLVRAEPRERRREEVSTAEGGSARFGPEAMARAFPRLTSCLPEAQLAELLGVSRLVGMECAGLHSSMTSVELAWEGTAGPPTALDYRVERWDPRLSALTILVEGAGLLGRVGALVRPAPVDQPPASELARLVEPGEFADMHGLVIGGSRGLGEATAKLLGVGGADVRLTYRTGGRCGSGLPGDPGGGRQGRGRRLRRPRGGGVLRLPAGLVPLAPLLLPDLLHLPERDHGLFGAALPRLRRVLRGRAGEVRGGGPQAAAGPAHGLLSSTGGPGRSAAQGHQYASAKAAGKPRARTCKLHPQLRFR